MWKADVKCNEWQISLFFCFILLKFSERVAGSSCLMRAMVSPTEPDSEVEQSLLSDTEVININIYIPSTRLYIMK